MNVLHTTHYTLHTIHTIHTIDTDQRTLERGCLHRDENGVVHVAAALGTLYGVHAMAVAVADAAGAGERAVVDIAWVVVAVVDVVAVT